MEFRRCYKCMSALTDDNSPICPECGYNNASPDQPNQALSRGSVLKGRYIIGCTLGQGGFGITYIGYDWVLDTPVCIKEFFPAGAASRMPDRTGRVYWIGSGSSGTSLKLSGNPL